MISQYSLVSEAYIGHQLPGHFICIHKRWGQLRQDALLAAEKNNSDTIRVSAPAPATTIVLREASAVAPVAVNKVVDKVAEQEIAEDNTMLVAEAGARRIKKRKSGNIAR